MVNQQRYQEVLAKCQAANSQLIAVTKYASESEMKALYDLGQRAFGERRAEEVEAKAEIFPKDVQWHFIGKIQSKKLKKIIPFIHLIQSIDRIELIEKIDALAAGQDRVVNGLIQFRVAQEESKHGLLPTDLPDLIHFLEQNELSHLRLVGVMSMATNKGNIPGTVADQEAQIKKEYEALKNCFAQLKAGPFANKDYFTEISMGMSQNYQIALAEGSSMVRLGSILFDNED